jgi:hypothetical protein
MMPVIGGLFFVLLFAASYLMWYVALDTVSVHGSTEPGAPAQRAGDAFLIELAVAGFVVVGVVTSVVAFALGSETVLHIGVCYLYGGPVLNLWGMLCAYKAGKRHERRAKATLALGISLPMLFINSIAVLVVHMVTMMQGRL